MASIATVKEQREQHDGRKMVAKFRDWCESTSRELTEANLQAWDMQHNRGRILASFGSDAEIRAKALTMLYRQYLDRYSYILLKVKGAKPIRMAGIRSNTLGLREHVATMNKDSLTFNADKIKANAKNDFRRAEILGCDIRTFRKLVNEALDEVEAETTN